MSFDMKYINAERLQAFLLKKLESYKSKMVDPSKYPIDHIDLMALLASEYQALIFQLESFLQEQPEADLEEEMDRFFEEMPILEHENIFEETYHMIARHFYEFRKNSK